MMASALIKGLLKAEVRAELLYCTVQRACRGSSVVLHTQWVLIRGSLCGLENQVLPAFCVSVSDPYKPSLEKLAAEGVITYDDNVKVADVSRSTS
jgi:hypothetical protein